MDQTPSRQPSVAFSLHHTLSTNARNQTSLAVSLDEARKPREALVVYDRAVELLRTYLTSFADSSPGFRKLTEGERVIVRQTRANLSSHLQSVESRRTVLRSTSASAERLRAVALGTRVGASAGEVVPRSTGGADNARQVRKDDPLVQAIEAEILDQTGGVDWDDIYGLDQVKDALNEMVVLPALRPDLYTGLRAPGRGILLFGPPGTGKTLVAKAVATNVKATFFSISASSLNSKFHGESERLVRTLFQVARERQPSFVFIDEVDSILGARSESEHEASRRLKTEFMAQFDGAGGKSDDKVYVMAASNRPQDLDDAVRRRLDRRIYVPLPDVEGRREFFRKLTAKNDNVKWSLRKADFDTLAARTGDFSGSDIKALCREASLMPLRELGTTVSRVRVSDVRACTMKDFDEALRIVRPSSNKRQIAELESWNQEFGSRASTQRAGRAKKKPPVSKSSNSVSASAPSDTTRSLVPAQSTRSMTQGNRGAVQRASTSKGDVWSRLMSNGRRK